MHNSQCKEFYPNRVFNSTLCAEGKFDERTNVRGRLCKDFGAPIVHKEDNRTLIGINHSNVEDCAAEPAIFVRITSYVNWILQTINETTSYIRQYKTYIRQYKCNKAITMK